MPMSLIFAPREILNLFILIQLAKEGSLHGYALASLIEETFGWKPSLTSIYNALKKMESRELVTFEEKIENSRVQKIYSITEQGRRLLEEKQRRFKEKLKKSLSHFFSLLEALDNIPCTLEKKQNSVKNVFTILRQISLFTILILNTPQADFGEVEKILTTSLTALQKLAEDNKVNFSSLEE